MKRDEPEYKARRGATCTLDSTEVIEAIADGHVCRTTVVKSSPILSKARCACTCYLLHAATGITGSGAVTRPNSFFLPKPKT